MQGSIGSWQAYSTKVARGAGLSASAVIASSSSPGASSAPVSPTSTTFSPCISTSIDSSGAVPVAIRTSGSAIADSSFSIDLKLYKNKLRFLNE